MNSMTGFGRAVSETTAGQTGFLVEMSSVNRKQLELKFSLPRELAMYEPMLRGVISSVLSRGSVMIRVECVACGAGGDAPDTSASCVDLPMAIRLYHAAKKLQTQLSLDSTEEAFKLLALPGVVTDSICDLAGAETENLLKKTTQQAVQALVDMRAAEGARLKSDFETRLCFLKEKLSEIEPLVKELPKLQYDKLLSRIQEMGLSIDSKDERLLRELVIFTDRADVTEEITRLKSHFSHFTELISDGQKEAGRSLDFLAQEMFREINTLGNKAPIPEVSVRIVAMKTELEKIREQVQNIE